jgi:hypothetical protein
MQGSLDPLNWPVAICSVSILPWLNDLWDRMPGPTAVYATISGAFMLFQMADKMGWLEYFKRNKQEPKK